MDILLVEDDPDLAEMYQLQLEHGGYSVTVSTSAQGALDALDAKPVELIILDLLLPQHNGLSVLYELHSYNDWQKLPVIILSSLPAREIGASQQVLKGLGVADS